MECATRLFLCSLTHATLISFTAVSNSTIITWWVWCLIALEVAFYLSVQSSDPGYITHSLLPVHFTDDTEDVAGSDLGTTQQLIKTNPLVDFEWAPKAWKSG